MVSVIKANVGTGMIQNAEYNQGRPYFASVRPLLHDPHRLEDKELEQYNKYNKRLELLRERVEEIKAAGVDVFDIELEMALSLDSIKKGSFDIVELYLDSINQRISTFQDKVASKSIGDDDKPISSLWDEEKEKVFAEYQDDIVETIEESEGELLGRKDILDEAESGELERIRDQMDKLKEEEEVILAKKTPTRQDEQRRTEIQKKKDVMIGEEKAIRGRWETKRKSFEDELTNLSDRRKRISDDKTMIEKNDMLINQRIEGIKDEMKEKLESEFMVSNKDLTEVRAELNKIESKSNIIDSLLGRLGSRKKKKEELLQKELELKQRIREKEEEISKEGREKRSELVDEKDTLLIEFNKIKSDWAGVIAIQKRRVDVLQEMIDSKEKNITQLGTEEEKLTKKIEEKERALKTKEISIQKKLYSYVEEDISLDELMLREMERMIEMKREKVETLNEALENKEKLDRKAYTQIKRELMEADDSSIILVSAKPQDHMRSVIGLLRSLISDRNLSVVYLSMTKPYRHIIKNAEEAEIDTSNLYIIDCISQISGDAGTEKPLNVVLVENPTSLEEMSMYTEKLLEDIKDKNRIFLMDSLSSLSIYNNPSSVDEFTHFVITKIRLGKIGGIVLSMKTKETMEQLKAIRQFYDREIEVGSAKEKW